MSWPESLAWLSSSFLILLVKAFPEVWRQARRSRKAPLEWRRLASVVSASGRSEGRALSFDAQAETSRRTRRGLARARVRRLPASREDQLAARLGRPRTRGDRDGLHTGVGRHRRTLRKGQYGSDPCARRARRECPTRSCTRSNTWHNSGMARRRYAAWSSSRCLGARGSWRQGRRFSISAVA